MNDSIVALAGSIGALALLALLVVSLGLAIFWPLMAFRAVQHLGGIRRELERMNDVLEQQPRQHLAAPAGRDAVDEARWPLPRRRAGGEPVDIRP